MTLAIGHSEDGVVVLDAIRERKPPFSPDAVTLEFAQLLKSYKVTKIQGDRYAGEWPADRFREHGISYETARNQSPISIAISPADQFAQDRATRRPNIDRAAMQSRTQNRDAAAGTPSTTHPTPPMISPIQSRASPPSSQQMPTITTRPSMGVVSGRQ